MNAVEERKQVYEEMCHEFEQAKKDESHPLYQIQKALAEEDLQGAASLIPEESPGEARYWKFLRLELTKAAIKAQIVHVANLYREQRDYEIPPEVSCEIRSLALYHMDQPAIEAGTRHLERMRNNTEKARKANTEYSDEQKPSSCFVGITPTNRAITAAMTTEAKIKRVSFFI